MLSKRSWKKRRGGRRTKACSRRRLVRQAKTWQMPSAPGTVLATILTILGPCGFVLSLPGLWEGASGLHDGSCIYSVVC